jgi:hypothetical protein
MIYISIHHKITHSKYNVYVQELASRMPEQKVQREIFEPNDR